LKFEKLVCDFPFRWQPFARDKAGGKRTAVAWLQVREQMQAEIDKYKRETEEALARTIAEMKCALEARLKEKIQLENEKERLEALVAQMQGQVNELQAQVSALIHRKLLILTVPLSVLGLRSG